MKFFVTTALFLALSPFAHSMTVDWAGTYRFEYVDINSTTLSSAKDRGSKGYFLNHLSLSPKIIATDGFNVVANMEVLPSVNYPGSQVGTDFSGGPANGTNTSYSSSASGTMGQNEGPSSIEVNQLYATWNHEYGQFAVGRMPIHFGLGIAHNAGAGLYDHWLETHDVVGYKFLIGNLSLMPMVGRTHHNYAYAYGTYATEQMIQVDYTNPETESTFAIFHQVKNANSGSNDAAAYFKPYEGTGTPTVQSGLSTTTTSLYIARGWQSFKFKMEAAFQSGNTGIGYNTYKPTGAAGAGAINLGGYGIATELEFPRPESKWKWSVRAGVASGDDAKTQNYEGFYFSKNYNIAMLLFNHPMGQYDVLRTGLNRQRDSNGNNYNNDQTVDEETLSNALYISPKFDYAMNDRWSWTNAITYAQTQSNPSATVTSVGSDLGYEWDTGFTYKPHDKFKISMDVGVFLPGTAWQEGTKGWDATMTYGFTTKAAINF